VNTIVAWLVVGTAIVSAPVIIRAWLRRKERRWRG
jgi:hypothetical protein